jgi:thiol-disulfide isomerase/thioredoxin
VNALNSLLDEPRNPERVVEQFTPSTTRVENAVEYPTHSTNFGKAKNFQGKQAPPFFVEQWLSEPVSVDGKVRVVEFWATWCPPCIRSIPHLNEYSKHFQDSVMFVGVSNEKKAKVQDFMKKSSMNYGVAVDTSEQMKKTIACVAIPLALVISSDGVVRWQGNPLQLNEDIIQQVLSADRGETTALQRGRWEVKEKNDQRALSE